MIKPLSEIKIWLTIIIFYYFCNKRWSTLKCRSIFIISFGYLLCTSISHWNQQWRKDVSVFLSSVFEGLFTCYQLPFSLVSERMLNSKISQQENWIWKFFGSNTSTTNLDDWIRYYIFSIIFRLTVLEIFFRVCSNTDFHCYAKKVFFWRK